MNAADRPEFTAVDEILHLLEAGDDCALALSPF
jgi:hypothetical protein